MIDYKNHPLIKSHSTFLWFEESRALIKRHHVTLINVLYSEDGTVYESLRRIHKLKLIEYEQMKSVIFHYIYTGKIEPLEEPNDALKFRFRLNLDEHEERMIF